MTRFIRKQRNNNNSSLDPLRPLNLSNTLHTTLHTIMSNTHQGRPVVPPGKTSTEMNLNSDESCTKESRQSLSCTLENYDDKSVCQPFFDIYKACRAAQNKKKWEERAKASRSGSWFG